MKSNFLVFRRGRRRCKVGQFTPARGQAYFFHNVFITAEHYGPLHLAVAYHPRSKEFWYVVSNEPTSMTTFEEYGLRFDIETFNQDVKEHLGFEDYQLRRLRGIKRHWYLSFVAYSLLGDQGRPGRSRWAVRGRFESTGQRCQAVANDLLGNLIHWVSQQLKEGRSPETVLQMLLA